MKILKFLSKLNPFKNKKEPEQYPYMFAKGELTMIAKSKGTSDEFNKIIRIYKGGELLEEMPYTKQLKQAIIEIDQIPFYEESLDEEEEFEFDPFDDLGGSKYLSGDKK